MWIAAFSFAVLRLTQKVISYHHCPIPIRRIRRRDGLVILPTTSIFQAGNPTDHPCRLQPYEADDPNDRLRVSVMPACPHKRSPDRHAIYGIHTQAHGRSPA